MKNNVSIAKSNRLNTSNFRNYTKMDYLVFLFLLSKIQRFNEVGEPLHNLELASVTITAQEFAEAFSLDINNSYTALRFAITSLQTKIIQFRDLFATDTQWTLITESSFYKDGFVTIHFNEKIWHHVANLAANFTKYKLEHVAELNTLPAIRLFELLIQFNHSGYFVDSLANFKFSLDKESYKEYKIFKRDILTPAIDELNAKHRLNIQLTEHREKRKVSKIEINFIPANTRKNELF